MSTGRTHTHTNTPTRTHACVRTGGRWGGGRAAREGGGEREKGSDFGKYAKAVNRKIEAWRFHRTREVTACSAVGQFYDWITLSLRQLRTTNQDLPFRNWGKLPAVTQIDPDKTNSCGSFEPEVYFHTNFCCRSVRKCRISVADDFVLLILEKPIPEINRTSQHLWTGVS